MGEYHSSFMLFQANAPRRVHLNKNRINLVPKEFLVLNIQVKNNCRYLKKCPHVKSIMVGISVSGGIGEGCSSKSDTCAGSIKDGIESLEPSLAVDEVKSRSAVVANVANNQVNVAGNATNVSVKDTRPNLTVGSQHESNAGNVEGQVLQGCELSRGDTKQTGVVVENGASERLVFGQGIGGNKNKGGSGVNNTGSGRQNGGCTVFDGLVDAPEFVCR